MNAELACLAGEAWDTWMAQAPVLATRLGHHEYDEEVSDLSAGSDAAFREIYSSLRARTEALDESQCTEQERITRAVLLARFDVEIVSLDARWPELDVGTGVAGAQRAVLHGTSKIELTEPQHAVSFLRRCERFETMLDQAGQRLREGLAMGRTPTRRGTAAAIAEIEAHLQTHIDTDGLVAHSGPQGWEGEAAWRDKLRDIVADRLRPALATYRDLLTSIVDVARDDDHAGLCWLPDGAATYAGAVRAHTTTDVSPAEIHELGLSTLAEIETEVAALGARSLGTASAADTFRRLRGDETLKFGSATEMREVAEAAITRATEAAPQWFGRLPSTGCIVKEIPPREAAHAPIAYYQEPALDGTRPGTYWLNTSRPETRSRYDAEATAFHEAIPGHHLQIALSLDLADLPAYRRLAIFTAYVEGWGLYAERLAGEMGLYSDDLQQLGFLSNEAMRACRLVVDTGLHHHGWSHRQSVDFIGAHTAWQQPDIAREVDRYTLLPGQALGYLVGRLEISRLRDEAQGAMGERFDIRGFHDVVLGSGGLPLAMLTTLVHEWIRCP